MVSWAHLALVAVGGMLRTAARGGLTLLLGTIAAAAFGLRLGMLLS